MNTSKQLVLTKMVNNKSENSRDIKKQMNSSKESPKALPSSLNINITDFMQGHAPVCGEDPFDYCAFPT